MNSHVSVACSTSGATIPKPQNPEEKVERVNKVKVRTGHLQVSTLRRKRVEGAFAGQGRGLARQDDPAFQRVVCIPEAVEILKTLEEGAEDPDFICKTIQTGFDCPDFDGF